MAIPAQRIKFNNIDTNVATADLRSITNNDSLNIADELGEIFSVDSLFSFSGAMSGLNKLSSALSSVVNPLSTGLSTAAQGVNLALNASKGLNGTLSNALNQVAGVVNKATGIAANISNQLNNLTNISVANLSALTNSLAGTGLIENAISSLTLTSNPSGGNGASNEALGALSRSVTTLAGRDFSKYFKPDTSNSNEASVFCNIASNTGVRGVFTVLSQSPNMSEQDLNITAANIINSSNPTTGTSQLLEVANSPVANNVRMYTSNIGTNVLSSFKLNNSNDSITEQINSTTRIASTLDNSTFRTDTGMLSTAAYGGYTGNNINNLLTNNTTGITNWGNYLKIAACSKAATISEDGIALTPTRTTACNTY